MPQPIYVDIRDDDWDSLRNASRRAQERLSELEGYGSTTVKHSNTNMDGNRILKGPAGMQYADPNEFITKDYLRCKEGAHLISNTLKSGGAAPLNLSKSTPGQTLLSSSGEYEPPDLIFPGDSLASITDLSPDGRMFKPVFQMPNPDYFSIVWAADGSFYTYCDIMYDSSIHERHIALLGAKSRFNAFPDESGTLRMRLHMPYIAWTWGSYITERTWGVGFITNDLRSGGTYDGPGWGQWRFSGNYTGPGFMNAGSTYSADFDFFPESNETNYPLGTYVIIDWEIQWSTSSNFNQFTSERCWWHVPGGPPYATFLDTIYRYDRWAMRNGIQFMVGYMCADGFWPIIAQFSKVELIQGFWSVSYI